MSFASSVRGTKKVFSAVNSMQEQQGKYEYERKNDANRSILISYHNDLNRHLLFPLYDVSLSLASSSSPPSSPYIPLCCPFSCNLWNLSLLLQSPHRSSVSDHVHAPIGWMIAFVLLLLLLDIMQAEMLSTICYGGFQHWIIGRLASISLLPSYISPP